jgi:glycosyltransferase involved in cell wall biosynthesis
VTYNHEAYIEKALNGFVSQITNFPFEVIVADDCSTDCNQKIIQEYADRYPAIIKPILRTKNIGVNSNYYDAVSRAKGEFIATCDGDDYWTDEKKLQKQVEFLTAHPDFALCCHPFVQHYVDGSVKDRTLSPWDYVSYSAKERGYLIFDDLISINPIGSMSAMYRWKLVQRLPEWMIQYPVADLIMHMLHADKGKIGVLDDVMAVYQRHSGGVWYNNDQKEHQAKLAKSLADMFIDIDYALENKHNEELQLLKGPKIKILFLAIENSIHSYKWISTVAKESRFEIQVYSTFKINGAPDLFTESGNIKLYSFGAKPPLEDVITEFQPDIVHSLHTQFSAYPILNVKNSWEGEFPVWINSIWGSDLYFWMREPTQNKALRDLLKHIDYIVTEGKRDEELAIQLGFTGKFLGPIPASAGIDFSKIQKIHFYPPSRRKEIAVKGYDRGVGRFRDALIALIRLKDELTGYRINVYSLEMDQEMLHVYANEAGLNICIVPQCDNDEMLALFSRSRVAIACSYSDGLPGSLLEAMATGAFPIQTNTAITEGWLSQQKSAILVPPDDVDALVKAINMALSNDVLIDEAATINRETIRIYADINKQRINIEKIYNIVAFENKSRITTLRDYFGKNQIDLASKKESDTTLTLSTIKPFTVKTKLKRELKVVTDAILVYKSGFFDAHWYLRTYPDVKEAKVNPLVHYLRHGAFEGRDPSYFFDSSWYLSEYLDVYATGMNPLVHFLRFGRFENRKPKKTTETS